MADNYFSKFPLVNYNNYAAVNITERVIISSEAFRNPYLFYPYELTEGERPDQLANQYYKDQYMGWMLYLSNGVVDPYYDWYISEKDFHLFLCKKYFNQPLVSVDNINTLKTKIMFYRNNWYEDKSVITIPEYNALPVELYRYWEAVYDNSIVVQGYKRVEEDWIINTNKIVKYVPTLPPTGEPFTIRKFSDPDSNYTVPAGSLEVQFDNLAQAQAIYNTILAKSPYPAIIKFANTPDPYVITGISNTPREGTNIFTIYGAWEAYTQNRQNGGRFPVVVTCINEPDLAPTFMIDEIVDITNLYNNNKGIAQISFSDESYLTIKNVSGSYSGTNGYVTIAGRESGKKALFYASQIITDNIPAIEIPYWSAVSVYDYEREKNEQNRSINVIESGYSTKISKQLTKMLK